MQEFTDSVEERNGQEQNKDDDTNDGQLLLQDSQNNPIGDSTFDILVNQELSLSSIDSSWRKDNNSNLSPHSKKESAEEPIDPGFSLFNSIEKDLVRVKKGKKV